MIKPESEQTLITQLKENLPQIKWETDKELGLYSYFRIGGPAAVYALIKKESHLRAAVHYCHDHHLPYQVVGGLSNLIVPDEGYPGVVLHNAANDFEQLDEKRVYVSSGWRMNALVTKLIDLGLGGLEVFGSLPGTLGGAIYNNAHFQQELVEQVVESVRVYDPERDESYDLRRGQCDFAYDKSCFQVDNRVILGANLQLKPADPAELREKAKEAAAWRLAKQPLNYPNSGCIFRNVPNTTTLKELFPQFAHQDLFPTGFLIEQAGLKGVQVGDVKVSDKHAAFVLLAGQRPRA